MLSLAEKAALFAARRREALGLAAPVELAPPPASERRPVVAARKPMGTKRRAKPVASVKRPRRAANAGDHVRGEWQTRGQSAPLWLPKLAAPGYKTHGDISREEETRLILAAQAGDRDAMSTLLVANEPLVWKFTRPYFKLAIDPEEVLQTGRIGLMSAIQRFDVSRGFRLSTYSRFWIRHEALRHIQDNEQDISTPVGILEAVRLAMAKGAETPEEAGAISGKKYAAEGYAVVRRRAMRLDAPAGDEDGRTFGDLLADPGEWQSDRLAEAEAQDQREALVREILDQMPANESEVLRRRFLANDGDGETLKEIGDSQERSRERIRQIETLAMARFRHILAARADDEDADALWGGWGDQREPAAMPREVTQRRGRSAKVIRRSPEAAPVTAPTRPSANEILARRPLAPPGARRILQEPDA